MTLTVWVNSAALALFIGEIMGSPHIRVNAVATTMRLFIQYAPFANGLTTDILMRNESALVSARRRVAKNP
jgi:hypothetical protein